MAEPFDPNNEIPVDTVGDFVCTLRNATSDTQAIFLWPSSQIPFQQAVTAALTTQPPGCCLVISNGLAIPTDLNKQRPEFTSGGTISDIDGSPQADIDPRVADYYHGTSTSQLLSILENGFGVSLGAGMHHLPSHVGVPVP